MTVRVWPGFPIRATGRVELLGRYQTQAYVAAPVIGSSPRPFWAVPGDCLCGVCTVTAPELRERQIRRRLAAGSRPVLNVT